MIQLQCRDCDESFESSQQQLNFQRIVKNRRDFVLCPICSSIDVSCKYEMKVYNETAKRERLQRRDAKRTVRQVRHTMSKM